MIEIAGRCVSARISPQGATVTATFSVASTTVEPLYEAPWLGQWSGDPLLTHLRGDFVCVPFGMPGHGYAANHEWKLVASTASSAVLAIDYPTAHEVQRVPRTVTCVDGALEFEDRITMRRQAALPLGLHPIFRLPDEPGAASLELPPAAAIFTPDQAPEPTARLLPGQRFTDPTAAPAVDSSADLTRLPWEGRSEDLVQLADVQEGRVVLTVDGHRTVLEWDTTLLRHCLLWISNRGRDYQPWNGRNRCLGIEPITSAFDLGAEASVDPNSLADAGFQTAVPLDPGKEHTIWHRLSMES